MSASTTANAPRRRRWTCTLTFGVPDEAAQDDDIAKTIDYAVVIERVRDELAARHFNLLETLGEYVIGLLLDEFRAPWVKMSHRQGRHRPRRAARRRADRSSPGQVTLGRLPALHDLRLPARAGCRADARRPDSRAGRR